jgi:hypothetical protein
MIIDVLLIGLLIARPSIGLAAWIAVLIILRHTPMLADEIARMAQLDTYHGMTLWAARLALPAWSHMSSDGNQDIKNPPPAVRVPVPGSVGSADTIAIAYADDATIRDQFLNTMIDQKDERGAWLFSANAIHAAVGGQRATVLAKVRDRRAATLPPLYRDDQGATVPATHPVSR